MDISKVVGQVKKIYDEIEHSTNTFKCATGLNCVVGCGDCCNRCEPHITVLEGLALAEYLCQNPSSYLRFQNRSLEHTGDILCPFYNLDQDFHCSIYEIRPMICRLYAFSGKTSPQGVIYQPCPKIEAHFPKEVALAHFLLKNNLSITIYKDVYAKLCELDFILATDFHPLTRSIEIAIEQRANIENGTYQEQQQKKSENATVIPFGQFIRNHLLNSNFFSKPIL